MKELNKNKLTSINTVTPKYCPIKCILCEGFGSFSHGRTLCNACKGKGYILVEAKEKEGNVDESK